MAEFDESTRIWSGIERPRTYSSEQGLGTVLIRTLEKTPDKVTQINDETGAEMTCDERRRKSIRVAHCLEQMGFKVGDVMMMAARNGLDVGPVMFGCFLIGAPVNPIDITFGKGNKKLVWLV